MHWLVYNTSFLTHTNYGQTNNGPQNNKKSLCIMGYSNDS